MFLFFKDIILIGASLLIGALISLGILPSSAVAPDVPPAARITQNIETEVHVTTTEETPAKTTPPETKTEVQTDTTNKEPAPLIDDFEKSLQDALNALAAIEAEKNAQAITQTALNEIARSAVVNILCATAGSGSLNSISGSGVVIHPNGVVLTNAHVAQFFLLEDYPTEDFFECVVRTGSPAKTTYTAELLFLPPSWIAQNAHKIDDEKPTGNGEHDYALLVLTGKTDGAPITSPLSYLPLVSDQPQKNSSVLLAGYPAGFLGGATIQTNLYKTSAEATIGDVYTFNQSTIDLFSIGGSVVAQSGSSGGAVAQINTTSNNGSALLGVIVTSSSAPDTASRDLRALSTNYIIRDFALERGASLESVLNSNLTNEWINFRATTFPTLSAALIKVLEGN